MIWVEMGSEAAIGRYFDWFEKQVRSRPRKLEQLRVYLETASWRIALALGQADFHSHQPSRRTSSLTTRPSRTPCRRSLCPRRNSDVSSPWEGKGNGKTKTNTCGGKGSWDKRFDSWRSSPDGCPEQLVLTPLAGIFVVILVVIGAAEAEPVRAGGPQRLQGVGTARAEATLVSGGPRAATIGLSSRVHRAANQKRKTIDSRAPVRENSVSRSQARLRRCYPSERLQWWGNRRAGVPADL